MAGMVFVLLFFFAGVVDVIGVDVVVVVIFTDGVVDVIMFSIY